MDNSGKLLRSNGSCRLARVVTAGFTPLLCLANILIFKLLSIVDGLSLMMLVVFCGCLKQLRNGLLCTPA